MKRVMGFFSSYCEGLEWSKIPPCGGALCSAVADAIAAVTVTVAVLATMEVMASDALGSTCWYESGFDDRFEVERDLGKVEVYLGKSWGMKKEKNRNRLESSLTEALQLLKSSVRSHHLAIEGWRGEWERYTP